MHISTKSEEEKKFIKINVGVWWWKSKWFILHNMTYSTRRRIVKHIQSKWLLYGILGRVLNLSFTHWFTYSLIHIHQKLVNDKKYTDEKKRAIAIRKITGNENRNVQKLQDCMSV